MLVLFFFLYSVLSATLSLSPPPLFSDYYPLPSPSVTLKSRAFQRQPIKPTVLSPISPRIAGAAKLPHSLSLEHSGGQW